MPETTDTAFVLPAAFVMPDVAPYDHTDRRAAQDAVHAVCAQIAAQAREQFPGEKQWLERACWPADPPIVPLDQFNGSFWPPVLTERLEELRQVASRAWLAPPAPADA